ALRLGLSRLLRRGLAARCGGEVEAVQRGLTLLAIAVRVSAGGRCHVFLLQLALSLRGRATEL
ncbi:hypothetical protein ADK38_37285, partial [Streptomyces varsoviensis]